ncbi:hypothetical protein [Clostridium perfringens]|uniref:hypothetical protein n=1 Tax=Clostridium perfringens TaxID=1502 RepID=UPI0023408B4C|nr:hypothetical protein [Clostridium perfringens]MDC4245740.1 hypothetical protein [Clostridium perfringens]
MNMIKIDMHNIVDNITVLFMSSSYSGQCLPKKIGKENSSGSIKNTKILSPTISLSIMKNLIK